MSASMRIAEGSRVSQVLLTLRREAMTIPSRRSVTNTRARLPCPAASAILRGVPGRLFFLCLHAERVWHALGPEDLPSIKALVRSENASRRSMAVDKLCDLIYSKLSSSRRIFRNSANWSTPSTGTMSTERARS